MANDTKTTRKCTKCFTSKLYNQFNLVNGKVDTWCRDCREAYGTENKKYYSSTHHSIISGVKYESHAVVNKSFFEKRIQELKEKVEAGACRLTEDTLKLNQYYYSCLFR